MKIIDPAAGSVALPFVTPAKSVKAFAAVTAAVPERVAGLPLPALLITYAFLLAAALSAEEVCRPQCHL